MLNFLLLWARSFSLLKLLAFIQTMKEQQVTSVLFCINVSKGRPLHCQTEEQRWQSKTFGDTVAHAGCSRDDTEIRKCPFIVRSVVLEIHMEKSVRWTQLWSEQKQFSFKAWYCGGVDTYKWVHDYDMLVDSLQCLLVLIDRCVIPSLHEHHIEPSTAKLSNKWHILRAKCIDNQGFQWLLCICCSHRRS